jgi:hypothetical protein
MEDTTATLIETYCRQVLNHVEADLAEYLAYQLDNFGLDGIEDYFNFDEMTDIVEYDEDDAWCTAEESLVECNGDPKTEAEYVECRAKDIRDQAELEHRLSERGWE